MKKLTTLLFVLVFASSMAFAQSNDSDVDQEGNGNDATVEQLGADHESYIIQNSKSSNHNGAQFGNEANVKQWNGNDNYSLIHQNEGGTSKDGYADVEQKGSENKSEIYQGYGYYNDMELFQEGDDNYSYMKQNGTGNEATVDQIGDDNESDAFQRGGAFLEVYQEGDDNIAVSDQDYSKQEGYISQWGNDNDVNLNQDGDDNSATVNQGHPIYMSSNNTADIDQIGNGNDASFGLQDGDGNDVTVSQNSNNNYTELFIKYGDENELTVDVDGNSNRSRMSISTQWGYMSSRNSIDLTQNGDGNYASGDIEGDRNIITLNQVGNNNRIGTSWYTKDGFDVYGEGNTITIDQMSNGNMSKNTVTGWDNSISVTQN